MNNLGQESLVIIKYCFEALQVTIIGRHMVG